MSPELPARTPTVSSIFRNLFVLLSQSAPRSAALLLGCRWSFGTPDAFPPEALTEYALPAGPVPYPAALARAGVHLTEHAGDDPDRLARHLAAGRSAVVAVDCFHLSHRPAYGRVHSARTLLVHPGRHPHEVVVNDAWDPPYVGPVPWTELQRARYSDVPLDRVREPVFAGPPVEGTWFSVEHTPVLVPDPSTWGRNLLRELCAEAAPATDATQGAYGLAALDRLRRQCLQVADAPPDERFRWARRASLVLRAELSSRVFLQALVRAVAGWTAEVRLRRAADQFDATLRGLETARDLLVKSLNRPELPCLPWAAGHLEAALLAEARLLEQARRATGPALEIPPTAVTSDTREGARR